MSRIPIVETYRGVGIHNGQSATRIANVVKPEIDRVFAMTDAEQLAAIAGDRNWAPEARLLAAAMVEAVFEEAAAERRVRPNVDLEVVRARVAGCDRAEWRDHQFFCSVLDTAAPGTPEPPRRDVPLRDDE